MTRADIIERVITTCPHMSLSDARTVMEMVLEEIAETLSQGQSVRLRKCGQFSVRKKRGRVGRHPRTGVKVLITPRRVLTFKPSPILLDVVAGRGFFHSAGVWLVSQKGSRGS